MRWSMYLWKSHKAKEQRQHARITPIYLFIFFLSPIVASVIIQLIEVHPNKK